MTFRVFRKISLTAVFISLVILTLHSFVPHHHEPQGVDMICTTSTHKHVHTCTNHIECIEQSNDCQGEIECGLSHSFIFNGEHHLPLIIFSIECHSIIPDAGLIIQTNYFVDNAAIPIQQCIVRNIPLRAPPVA